MSVGRRTRLAAVAIIGVAWILAPQSGPWMERTFANPGRVMYTWTGFLTLLAIAVGRWGQESLSKTIVNRRMRAAMLVTMAGQFMLEVANVLLDVPFVTGSILHFIVWALCSAFFSAMVESRVWPAAAAYSLGLFVAIALPAQRWHVMTVCHLALITTVVLAWGKFEEDRPRAIHERIKRRIEERSSRRPPPNG